MLIHLILLTRATLTAVAFLCKSHPFDDMIAQPLLAVQLSYTDVSSLETVFWQDVELLA